MLGPFVLEKLHVGHEEIKQNERYSYPIVLHFVKHQSGDAGKDIQEESQELLRLLEEHVHGTQVGEQGGFPKTTVAAPAILINSPVLLCLLSFPPLTHA